MVILNKFIKYIREEALGIRDENNKLFTSSEEFKSESLVVLYNGQELTVGVDFSILGFNSFSLIYMSPKSDDVLEINYTKR